MNRLTDTALSESVPRPAAAPERKVSAMERGKYRNIVDCIKVHAKEVPERLAIEEMGIGDLGQNIVSQVE